MRTILAIPSVLALCLLSVAACRPDKSLPPGGLPLPRDASEQSGMAPRGMKMTVFKVPRSRDVVSEELRANLSTDGWTIDEEELSPSHRALRWKLAKAGDVLDVRITGDGNDAAIIITQP